MQGATLSDYYCEHDIAGDAVSGHATNCTWFFEVSRDSQEVFTLETAFACTDLVSRGLDRVQAIGEVGQEGLHRVKGRLSLGWFEAGKRYEHTIAGGAERVNPPFPEPECSRFASHEERAEYWLLRSLHHIRTEYPEAFKNVSFDWRGVCIVAQVPIRAGRVALDLLIEKGLISGVRYDPTTQAGQFEPVGYMYISAGGVDYYRGLVTTQPTASTRPALPPPQTTSPSSNTPNTQSGSILIVTITKVETQAVLETFSQAAGKKWTRQVIGDKIYYDLGVHGGAPVFMVQSEMGTATPAGALLTVRQAIQDLHPQAVIMCGIAFGLRPNKQKLGDVLVARQLGYYEPQKVDLQKGQMLCGDRTTASERLLRRFRSGEIDWEGPSIHFGLVLSGEKLVNDPAFRDWLLNTEPEAVGGEMEGAGLYAAAREAKVDWILVKAICDWADGTKNDDAQPLAARNAAQFVLHVLQLGGWGGTEQSRFGYDSRVTFITK